jgi:hypothetical protein
MHAHTHTHTHAPGLVALWLKDNALVGTALILCVRVCGALGGEVVLEQVVVVYIEPSR